MRGRGRHADAGGAVQPIDRGISAAIRRYDAGDNAAAKVIAEELVRNDPGSHEAWNLLGAIAALEQQHPLAVRHFERAIALQPANSDYLSNCGEACRRAGWLDDAIDHSRAAVAADPRNGGAHYNLGLALHAVGEIEDAHTALTNALAIQPDTRTWRSAFVFVLCHHPDIDGAVLLAEHRRWHALHARDLAPKSPRTALAPQAGAKLRIGYVSADFRSHSLAYFIEPIWAHHDRGRFELFCYSNTRRTDDVTARLRSHTDHWRDITALSDEAAAALVSEDQIDILVDLSGHTADSRMLVFARQPAPLQLTYVGYPNTTGLAAMDYRISDVRMDPPGVSDAMYTESLLRMPHSLWCYRPPAGMPAVGPLPALQRGVTTFGSLHNFSKLNHKVLDVWARMLARNSTSELLIAGVPAGETAARLRARFATHGIDPARLQLIGKVDFDEYLKLYQRIDIGLDAFPYAGGTTTCESLWMGVPIITLAGNHGVSRAGVSLLTAVGLQELIADDSGRYIEIAVDLANSPHRLAEMRAGLRERLQRSPLMDEAGFTRDFEAALTGAFQASMTRGETTPT